MINRNEADKIILELQNLRHRAFDSGLLVAAQAIGRAMNAAGWEIAGNIDEADKAAYRR